MNKPREFLVTNRGYLPFIVDPLDRHIHVNETVRVIEHSAYMELAEALKLIGTYISFNGDDWVQSKAKEALVKHGHLKEGV